MRMIEKTSGAILRALIFALKGVPEEVWDKGSEDMFENITKGFCNLGKEIVAQVQKVGDCPAQDEPRGPHKVTL